jgi:hypothetical protein
MTEIEIIQLNRELIYAVFSKANDGYNCAYGIEGTGFSGGEKRPLQVPAENMVLPKYRNFNLLSPTLLNVLRYKIYTVADTDTLTSYANGIFRYSEIWLYKLYATQLSEKKNAAEVNLLLINVCNFLIDYSRLSKDLRFLNTALKILQLKKMPVLRKQLAKDLTTSQQHYYRLRIRAVLLLEHQVQQLLSGEK